MESNSDAGSRPGSASLQEMEAPLQEIYTGVDVSTSHANEQKIGGLMP
jgi:hypothetical protein